MTRKTKEMLKEKNTPTDDSNTIGALHCLQLLSTPQTILFL